MLEITQEPRHDTSSHPSKDDPRRTSLIAHCSLLVASFCGFVAVFGIAHLLLIHITKPSGYVFFGTLAVVSLLAMALLCGFGSDRAALTRFGFGALLCACAIPVIYLARFAPEGARPTVRNLFGLPFFILALIGPGVFVRFRRGKPSA
jgi:hypothetical protein